MKHHKIKIVKNKGSFDSMDIKKIFIDDFELRGATNFSITSAVKEIPTIQFEIYIEDLVLVNE